MPESNLPHTPNLVNIFFKNFFIFLKNSFQRFFSLPEKPLPSRVRVYIKGRETGLSGIYGSGQKEAGQIQIRPAQGIKNILLEI